MKVFRILFQSVTVFLDGHHSWPFLSVSKHVKSNKNGLKIHRNDHEKGHTKGKERWKVSHVGRLGTFMLCMMSETFKMRSRLKIERITVLFETFELKILFFSKLRDTISSKVIISILALNRKRIVSYWNPPYLTILAKIS